MVARNAASELVCRNPAAARPFLAVVEVGSPNATLFIASLRLSMLVVQFGYRSIRHACETACYSLLYSPIHLWRAAQGTGVAQGTSPLECHESAPPHAAISRQPPRAAASAG